MDDEYEKLHERLINSIPDFKLHLKFNPQSQEDERLEGIMICCHHCGRFL